MRTLTRVVAAMQVALIFPAAIFMTAVLVAAGDAPQYDVARIAQRIVMWYSARMWTLWLLLLTLPFAVLITGCATLLAGGRVCGSENGASVNSRHRPNVAYRPRTGGAAYPLAFVAFADRATAAASARLRSAGRDCGVPIDAQTAKIRAMAVVHGVDHVAGHRRGELR
jgi:hypothetical protein